MPTEEPQNTAKHSFAFKLSLLGYLAVSLFGLTASTANAQNIGCVPIPAPKIEYAQGSTSVEQNNVVSSVTRICLPTPNGPVTSLTFQGARFTPSGEVELYIPGQNTNPNNAAVFSLIDSSIEAGSGDFLSREAIPVNINGKLRVNIVGTTIGSGRSMTFAPFNGADVDPTEVYFQSNTPMTYDDLTVAGATNLVFGAYDITSRVDAASDFTFTNSSISSTSSMEIAAGSSVFIDNSSSLAGFDFDTSGTLAGNGTVTAVNFTLKNGGTLAPGASIGTLTINSDVTLEAGSTIISEVDPSAPQKADLVSVLGAVTGLNDTTFQVEAAQPGLIAQAYAAGNPYTVLTSATSLDGDTPNVVAGGSLPALSVIRVVNTPSADGRVDLAFDAAPVTMLPSHPSVTTSPNTTHLVTAVTTTTTTTPGTTLTSGHTIATAVTTLTNTQLTGFNTVHAEPYSSYLTVGLEQMDMISNSVLRHTTCAGFTGAETAVDNATLGGDAFDAANRADQRASCADRRLWVDTVGVRGNVDGQNGLGSYSYSLSALLLGADILRFDDGAAGIFAGIGRSSMDEHDQVVQDFSTDVYHLGIYGRITAGAWDIASVLGFSKGTTSASRTNPSLGRFTGGVSEAEFDRKGIHASLQARRSWGLEQGGAIASVFGVNYGKVWQDQATETGGGDFNYQIASADAEALTAFAGVEYSKSYGLGNGIVTPIAFARYEFDFMANKNNEHDITATSALFGTFNQVGQNRGASGAVLGLGANYQLSDTVEFSAGYSYSLRSNGDEHGLGANLRVVF